VSKSLAIDDEMRKTHGLRIALEFTRTRVVRARVLRHNPAIGKSYMGAAAVERGDADRA